MDALFPSMIASSRSWVFSFPLAAFENEVLRHLQITSSQLYHNSWASVRMFQYWYEYKGKMGYASKYLFSHLFFREPSFKGRVWPWVSPPSLE